MALEGVLLGAVIAESIVVSCVALAIVTHSLSRTVAGRRQRRLLADAIAALARGVADESDTPLDSGPLRRLGREAQVDVLMRVLPSVTGDDRGRVTALCHDIGLVAHAQKRLRHRSWWVRLKWTRFLATLEEADAPVDKMLADDHRLVRAEAATWSVVRPDERAVRALVARLGEKSPGARYEVRDAILRIGAPAAPALLEWLSTHPKHGIAAGLDVAAGLADSAFRDVALRYAEHPDAPVRAAAATLLGRVGGTDAEPALAALLADPDPTVRQRAAWAVAQANLWQESEELGRLLEDPEWLVRRAAALALQSLGSPGILELKVHRDHENRLARDVVAEAFAVDREERLGAT